VIDAANGRSETGVADAVVQFAEVTDAEITAYVASGEPLDVAGGFTLDGRSAPFVERIEGHPSTVIGLSLPMLRDLLARLGVPLVDLWC
jgi:septum formation protein